jgi:NAD(P)-dependent dehydrogenase (short-subunit alcohol dehydrogenase family)
MDVLGTVRGCEALHGYLEQSQHGSVVILASTAATETFIAPQAFNAMKASLLTYSGQLAQAWGPEGIRVNAVSPGPVFFEGGNWDDVKNAMPEFFAKIEADHALGRMGTVDEVAKTIVFLASPASAWTTGTNVIVDGGFTKRVHF